MAGMAKVEIIGNIGRDAEIKYMEDGTATTKFTVAVTPPRYGNKEPVTQWFFCTMWGKRGETLSQYLLKGTNVYVDGQLTVRTYTSQADGETKVSVDVRVNEVVLMGKKGDNEGGQRGSFGAGEGFSSDQRPAFGGGTAPKGKPDTKPSGFPEDTEWLSELGPF